MGGGRTTPIIPDLFSAASPQETAASRPPKLTTSSRHILPGDLPAAIKHLNDQELEQLPVAVTAEQILGSQDEKAAMYSPEQLFVWNIDTLREIVANPT